jgi:4a-hydroxytetrahydrobiopterin dehydratase
MAAGDVAVDLARQRCVPCGNDTVPATDDEIRDLLPQVPEWELVDVDGVKQLRRVFAFPDFASALGFTNAVGAVAEAENHHPALLTEWGSVTVTWWTHKIEGLHRNDFVMAAKTDVVGAAAES